MKYNLRNVTKIRVLKKRVSNRWSFHPAKTRLFGLIKFPEGFVDNYSFESNIQEDCPYNHYAEKAQHSDNMIVYEKPNIIMWLNDGDRKTFYFETVEELLVEKNKIIRDSECKWY